MTNEGIIIVTLLIALVCADWAMYRKWRDRR